MKKTLRFFAAALLFVGLISTAAFGAKPITVVLDGKPVVFDVAPQIINGRTMVPMRAIFEALGAEIVWDGPTQTVTGIKGNTTVKMTIGNKNMYVNERMVTLDSPPTIIDGRTLAPARAIAEGFACAVGWDGATSTVTVSSDGTLPAPAPAPAKDYTLSLIWHENSANSHTIKESLGFGTYRTEPTRCTVKADGAVVKDFTVMTKHPNVISCTNNGDGTFTVTPHNEGAATIVVSYKGDSAKFYYTCSFYGYLDSKNHKAAEEAGLFDLPAPTLPEQLNPDKDLLVKLTPEGSKTFDMANNTNLNFRDRQISIGIVTYKGQKVTDYSIIGMDPNVCTLSRRVDGSFEIISSREGIASFIVAYQDKTLCFFLCDMFAEGAEGKDYEADMKAYKENLFKQFQ